MTPNEEWGLIGRVAIVTGGGAAGDGIGNGRAAAILLARAGAKVLVVDRELPRAERTVAMIATEGGDAAAVSYDVTNSAQCAAWSRTPCPVGADWTAWTITSASAVKELWSRRPRRTGRM
jgi:NADP-dependent 3-hydroxy acid dehydrogenase YdfG